MSRFIKTFVCALSFGTVLLSAQEGLLFRAAVAPPTRSISGHKHPEGDEIDSELEAYFSSIEDKGDYDEKRIASLFGDDSERILEERRVTSLANRGALDYMTSYKVRRGDSIWSISRKMQIPPKQILKHNQELKKRPLYIGEEIIILREEIARPVRAPRRSIYRYHIVKKGEYLGRIARKYRISVKQLCAWNRIRPDSTIRVGQRLRIKQRGRKIPKGYVYSPLFSWPVRGVITSGFGRRSNPFTRRRQYHKGIDIGAKIGTPFRAARDGVVIFSRRMGGYGNCIFIRHTNSYVSVYAHAKQSLVRAGDVVKRGQIIGKVGRTGSATGPHLHFEVRKWKRPMNPFVALSMKELVPRQRKVANR